MGLPEDESHFWRQCCSIIIVEVWMRFSLLHLTFGAEDGLKFLCMLVALEFGGVKDRVFLYRQRHVDIIIRISCRPTTLLVLASPPPSPWNTQNCENKWCSWYIHVCRCPRYIDATNARQKSVPFSPIELMNEDISLWYSVSEQTSTTSSFVCYLYQVVLHVHASFNWWVLFAIVEYLLL